MAGKGQGLLEQPDRVLIDALEWLAAMCSHIPNNGERMVHYYGYYTYIRG